MQGIALFPGDQHHRTFDDIAELLTAVGVHGKGFPALGQFQQNGFHLIFLGIGHDPVHRAVIPFIHKEIPFAEDDALLLVLLEEFGQAGAQRLYNIVEGGNGRGSEVAFRLGEKGPWSARPSAGQLFQGQPLLDAELLDFMADIQIDASLSVCSNIKPQSYFY